MAFDQLLDFEFLTIVDTPPPNTSIHRIFGPFYRVKGSPQIRCVCRIFRLFPFWTMALASLFHVAYFFRYAVPGLPESFRRPVGVVYLIFYTFAALNLFATYFTNPGALPWNWSISRKKSYTSSELCTGVATTIEQFEWALSHDSPARSHFSKKTGFFILRADHDCFWVNGWIGIGNHRYFLNGMAGLAIFCLYSGFWMLWTFFYGTYGNFFFFISILGITGFCAFLSVGQGFLQARNISLNATIIEHLKGKWATGRNPYRKDCIRNWEEVYGPRVCCPLWCCPFPIPRVEDGFGYDKGANDDERCAFIHDLP
jgi:hypothetical protein